MLRNRTSLVTLTLCFSLGLTAVLPTRTFADDKPAAAAEEAVLAVQPGTLGGSIVELDGKTPIKGATVQLLDPAGKVVAEASTDEKGAFSLGKRDNGKYTLTVGQAKGTLLVKEGAQATSLKFVLDNKVATGDNKAGGSKLAAISTAGVVLIAGAAALVGLGAGLGIGYAVWGTRSEKKVFVPVSP
ncbi:MAG TPA: carboxypeptidase-like regulatory domain-containing protein [Planctomycetota bacterium]|nr:carboxypeptidase-like regulatory domain-containing protein [Planctomycetota bacterium]